MLDFFDQLHGITPISVCVRLLLAVLCGGIVGIEREYKRRPAGFRTHILICLGAAMTTMTSQYLLLVMHYPTDITRLGAQVVAGIGFIGAGSIIVTRRQRVRGLTTAAGLWASAIVGLCLGVGFYEGALLATVLILLAELLLSRLEHRLLSSSPEINLYMEYRDKQGLEEVLKLYRRRGVAILGMEITRSDTGEGQNACALFYLRLDKRLRADALVSEMRSTDGVLLVEEL